MPTAQTLSITEETFGTVKKIKWVWTSTDAGVVTGVATTNAYSGKCERLVTIPASGDAAPTDDYDVVINDEDTTDVLMGGGANRDTADTEQVAASSLGIVANDKLTLEITGAGDANGGTVILYIR